MSNDRILYNLVSRTISYANEEEKMSENIDEIAKNINNDIDNDVVADVDNKSKKGIYIASSVVCSLATSVVGFNIYNQNQKNSKNIDIVPINNNDDSLKDSSIGVEHSSKKDNVAEQKDDNADIIEVVDSISSEPNTEEELKIAIDIAKAKLMESYANENSESSDLNEGLNDEVVLENIDHSAYNLAEELSDENVFVDVGKSMGSNVVENAMRYWSYFEYYGYTYGIDPYLLVAIAAQESRGDHESTIENGKYYKGAGYGIMQIEKPGIITQKITAYNHVTDSYEIMNISSTDDVKDVGLNIKAGAMQLAQRCKEQQYNPYVTLQGYNYGSSGIKYALSYYVADGNEDRVEEIYGNAKGEHILYYISLNDNKWLDKPTSSGLTARDWYTDKGWMRFGAGGGDRKYVEHVMRYYGGNERPYILKDTGEKVVF